MRRKLILQRTLIICSFWNLRQLWLKGGSTEVGMALSLMLHRMVEGLALLFILGDPFIQIGCQLDIVFGHIVNESIVFDKPKHPLIARIRWPNRWVLSKEVFWNVKKDKGQIGSLQHGQLMKLSRAGDCHNWFQGGRLVLTEFHWRFLSYLQQKRDRRSG